MSTIYLSFESIRNKSSATDSIIKISNHLRIGLIQISNNYYLEYFNNDLLQVNYRYTRRQGQL